MFKEFSSIRVSDIPLFKDKLIHWANRFPIFCYLDSNDSKDSLARYDFIIGIDSLEQLSADDLEEKIHNEFCFGYINYEYSIPMASRNPSFINYEDSFFFKPRYVIYGIEDRIYCNRSILETMEMYHQIDAIIPYTKSIPSVEFECTTSIDEYQNTVSNVQEKILKGDLYELNYCIEFQAIHADFDAIATFCTINNAIAAPMSGLFKLHDKWILSFSPERFMTKRGNMLIAQPIKGTIRRELSNTEKDNLLKTQLETSPKERAENSMIVDLMRNDMTTYAKAGTICVDEYCKVYSFNTVHHMISTISAKLFDEKNGLKALFNALPVGSMTGAPKKEVVKTIEEIENFNRGIYAGNIGYIDPNNDFDFNVVIRSLQYDQRSQRASIHVGSAITLNSESILEYEECLLKAEGIKRHFKK